MVDKIKTIILFSILLMIIQLDYNEFYKLSFKNFKSIGLFEL